MNKLLTNTIKIIVFIGACSFLTACSISIDGDNYKAQDPKFDIETFFVGNVTAWGIVQDRSGEIVQRFKVNIDGIMQNGNLILNESFDYSLGEGPLKRVWTISKNTDGTYTGEAGDIVGVAKGVSHGNAFNFSYEMDLPVGDSSYRVNFDDWFFSVDDKNMMNRSYIRKFGVVMAEVTIFMQKQA